MNSGDAAAIRKNCSIQASRWAPKFVVALGVLAIAALLTPQARAQLILGDMSQFAVLFNASSGGSGYSLNDDTSAIGVTGNVGVGHGSKLSMSGPGTLKGNLYFADPVTGANYHPASNYPVTGTVSQNQSLVNTAIANANSLSTSYASNNSTPFPGQTSTSAKVNISGNTALSAPGVYTMSQFNLTGTLTLTGSASQIYVFNVTGGGTNNTINGNIVLSGGLTPDNVLFNFTEKNNGNVVSFGGNGKVNADFFVPNGNFSVDRITIMGRIFGGSPTNGQSSFQSGANVIAPVPEPSSIALVFSALAGAGGFAGWRRLWRARTESRTLVARQASIDGPLA